MTTISRNGIPSAEVIYPRRVALSDTSEVSVIRKGTGQSAEFAQRKAEAAARDAAFRQRELEVEKSKHVESREIYLSNISDLSLDHAKKQLGIVQVMIRDRDDVGMNVHGRYGDKKISDLRTYVTSLKDYISKKEAPGALLAAASGLNGNSTSPSGQNKVSDP